MFLIIQCSSSQPVSQTPGVSMPDILHIRYFPFQGDKTQFLFYSQKQILILCQSLKLFRQSSYRREGYLTLLSCQVCVPMCLYWFFSLFLGLISGTMQDTVSSSEPNFYEHYIASISSFQYIYYSVLSGTNGTILITPELDVIGLFLGSPAYK